jgi:hypothetical protein
VIRVEIAPEPPAFDEKVRKPGQNALALLEGKPLPHQRRGRPIATTKKVQGRRVPRTIDDFDYWRECLDDLHEAYRGICAYYAFRIEKAVLPQVDHFVAKKDLGQTLAYEWSNFRLACGHANTCKNDHPGVLDPASIQDGWFQLDLVTLDVRPCAELPPALKQEVENTIRRLKLREGRALEVRRHAMDHFRSGRVGLAFLQMDHPFLAKELVRQGIHAREQLPPLPPRVVETVEPELRLEPT